MLRVRVPLNLENWDGNDNFNVDGNGRGVLISSFFQGNTSKPSTYDQLPTIASWDFTMGMILGCFITQQPDEDCAALTRRMQPFLFLHARCLAEDGESLG